jgi:hypothetical protein
MSIIVADKLTRGWHPPQIRQRKKEMDDAYKLLKDFDKTHKDFDDYSKKKQLATVEKELVLPPKNNSPVINLTPSSLSNLFILKSPFTGDLVDYCAYVSQQISELEASLIKNNVFIAAYEIDDNKEIKMKVEPKMLENYILYGYVEYFFANPKNRNIKHKYSFYKKKTDPSKIVVLTDNNYLVCNGNLYEENSIYYTLINRLLYFQSNIRELCCYQYKLGEKEYVLFSRYTKRELRNLCLDPVILDSLVQVEFFKDYKRDIITFLPVTEYIKQRNKELKERLTDKHEKVVRSNTTFSGKYLDDTEMYPNLYEELINFESAVSTPYACLYLRPDIDPKLFKKELE